MASSSRARRWQIALLIQWLLVVLNLTGSNAQCLAGVSHRLKMSALLDSIYPSWTEGCVLREASPGKSEEQVPIDENLPVDWDRLMISANDSAPTLRSNLTDMADYLLELADRTLDDSMPAKDAELSASEAGER
uniref:Uncharacterized protein n=1 Tax=Anopheles culicifacies TaxID=139723 RepID=A0A182MCN4_9DIPT